ncbi:MAG: O-acetyl-ADP-ribose deacetylase [Chloroflexota bacterium]|jgi:O-acetyl-ADP-ribose deacetylase (regulator of RNase III)|nr:O-acetyl-ADP-ribose deacetylase [Chloroflexota bacterium]
MARIEIDVWQGEIAELEVDALVVPANESLFMTAGAAASVKRHGGDEIERDAVDQGPAAPGTAIATQAGSLPAAYVIHAIGVGHDRIANREQLAGAIRTALAFSEPLQLRRLAVALIGIEHGAFTPPEAAQVLIDELTSDDLQRRLPESVVIATVNGAETLAVTAALATRRAHVT